jgi:GTPase
VTAFIDEARIRVKAGDGGKGAIAFRREKFVPKGGPSGGDGGDGGSVLLEVDEGLSTLLDFRYRTEYRAPSGESGGNKDMYGRAGEDLVLRVPPGTQVWSEDTGALLADLKGHGTRFVAARGGRGGRGNIHFATATEQAPRKAEPGTPGQERHLRLELKLLADVGLVGFPNVGKSSLIARVSAARPKIADYPFTTLVPNLGVVRLSGDRSFVVADVPGLIEGAHEGAGLGTRFLKHLERTRVLVHVLEVGEGEGRSPIRDYEAVRAELEAWSPELAARPEIIVLNKLDLPETRKRLATLERALGRRGKSALGISAVTGAGIPELLEAMWARLREARAARDLQGEGSAGEPRRAHGHDGAHHRDQNDADCGEDDGVDDGVDGEDVGLDAGAGRSAAREAGTTDRARPTASPAPRPTTAKRAKAATETTTATTTTTGTTTATARTTSTPTPPISPPLAPGRTGR